MSGVNHPSSAAAARNYEATQTLKRSVQAAFDGNDPASLLVAQLCCQYILFL